MGGEVGLLNKQRRRPSPDKERRNSVIARVAPPVRKLLMAESSAHLQIHATDSLSEARRHT